MKKKNHINTILGVLLYLITTTSFCQNVDLENLGGFIGKGKPLKISGGIAANSIFYNSNQDTGREAFTYFIQGNLNISYMALSVPLSYSYSNQGSQLEYQLPFKFNRLSLHPKYKWVQAHIGDVAMTFSPYTLSGHQFTGGGVELTPKGNFKIAAMAGRLLKATEDNDDARTIPAFYRFGYGAKFGYEKEKYAIAITGFYAKDNINSIALVPDEKGVTPKENLVISIDGSYKVMEGLEVKAEYASTAITQDLRAETSNEDGQGLAGLLFNNRASTEYYKALKAGFDYSFGKSTVGVAYERIDPGYETLGAYFFNNDFENITLNYSSTLFKDKINYSFNIGYQRDDLENQKEQTTSRTVGSVNATYTASDKLTITGSYSNFSTFTNARVNQFDNINDDNLLDNIDEQFDYKQLSQNANINVNYVLSKKEDLQQNLNLNYALADVANEQDGIVRIGDASTFHNMNTSYTLGFPKQSLNITTALNGTLNTIGRENATTWGPTLSLNKKFFENKLNSSFAASYNTSDTQSGTTSVTNFRASASYVYKEKHNFNLNAIQLFKTLPTANNQDLTITFGYNYTFDLNAPKLKKKKKEKEFSFSYKSHIFSGSHSKISKDITSIVKGKEFETIKNIKSIVDKLSELEAEMIGAQKKSDKFYKKRALNYLDYLYKHKDYLDTYHQLVFSGLKKLYKEAKVLDYSIKQDFFDYAAAINEEKSKGKKISEKEKKNLEIKERKYKAHKWMQEQINVLSINDVIEDKGFFKEFKKMYLSKVFEMLQKGKTNNELISYLEIKLADFYHKKTRKI
ncbi:hypothetical protein [uncultured Polaribacter sp.]|uniref:hypothetical protein n=1 Tax=uncultured Polaribacter sp. TaxID=174711 RepID=UPI0026355E72|nr:hypothetical protein [uncultured Polaribacter sp.]